MPRSFNFLILEQAEQLHLFAIATVAMTAIVLWYLLVRERREIVSLKNVLREFARTGVWPSRVGFQSDSLQSVWQTARLLGSPKASVEDAQGTFDRALLLGRQLAEAADMEKSVATTLVRVLLEQMQPEALAAAVMLKDSESEQIRVLDALGIPSSRIESSLLMCFDDVSREDRLWGYRSVDDGYCFDFRVFDVGLSLLIPLRESEEVVGGIWVGFRALGAGLSAERMDFLRAMAEHAAASFSSAKRAETRTQGSQRERDYLLGLSHDIRSPGNRALYAVHDILESEEEKLGSLGRERLHIVERAIQEQLELLGDMVKFSSLKNGIVDAQPSSVSVHPFLSDVVSSHLGPAEAKGLVLRTLCDPSICVKADPKHLKRILSNLLTNAIAYTKVGQIEIRVVEIGEEVGISVHDTGPGVPSNFRSQLFTPFSRETKDGGGLGLGLSLAKSLAQLNRGDLVFRPNKGGGAVFTLSLPVERNSEAFLAKTLLPESYPVQCLLVLDDDAPSSRSTVRVLSSLARIALSAHSVTEARQALNLHKPDVVVSDFHFLDGTLLDIEDAIEDDALLIVLSGDSSDVLRRRLRSRRNTVFFEKPASADELRNVISGGKSFAKVA